MLTVLICINSPLYGDRSMVGLHAYTPHVQVGARGYDEWGAMFASSMKRSMVGIGKMRIQQGPTGFTSSMRITPSKLALDAFCVSAPHVSHVIKCGCHDGYDTCIALLPKLAFITGCIVACLPSDAAVIILMPGQTH